MANEGGENSQTVSVWQNGSENDIPIRHLISPKFAVRGALGNIGMGHLIQNLEEDLIWVRHPMFVHHRIKMGKELRGKVREKKKQGIKYLTDYVDGDTYVVE